MAQSEGLEVIGTLTFNGIRMIMGGTVLLPVIAIMSGVQKSKNKKLGSAEKKTPEEKKKDRKNLIAGGLVCGTVLCVSSNLQQAAFGYTTVGKVGFITALYMLLVPIISLVFFKKRVSLPVWIGVGLGVVGLYLLCAGGKATFGKGELLALACSVGFAIHILVIDKYSAIVDGVKLSCAQFFVSGIISVVLMFIFEKPSIHAIMSAAPYLLYTGIFSCGVAFTFQTLGQRDSDPTVASLLLCLESVFAVIFAWVLIDQKMSVRELGGCIIMFVAIVLAQLPADVFKKKQRA
ncbi:MAG: DMT family transporter [Oscillospiraceae bacterium]|nr:DMT family transporter [Oscillospiraceae bacterium]